MLSQRLTLLLACVVLQARAALYRRCTQVFEGKVLSGEELNEEPVELAAGERRYDIPLPLLLGCETGWAVTVCDLVAPEVVVSDELDSLRVLRTGPLWLAPTLEVTRFCTPVVAPTTGPQPVTGAPAVPLTVT